MDDLDPRLTALEHRVVVTSGPPEPATRRRSRRALALAAAPILLLAVAATAVAGTAGVIAFMTSGSSALDQGSLADAGLECLAPADAATWLEDHGYQDVIWDAAVSGSIQVGPDTTSLPPLPEGSRTVPSSGVIVTWWLDGETVHVLYDATPGAARPAACPAG